VFTSLIPRILIIVLFLKIILIMDFDNFFNPQLFLASFQLSSKLSLHTCGPFVSHQLKMAVLGYRHVVFRVWISYSYYLTGYHWGSLDFVLYAWIHSPIFWILHWCQLSWSLTQSNDEFPNILLHRLTTHVSSISFVFVYLSFSQLQRSEWIW
jgi:hypothetical protein